MESNGNQRKMVTGQIFVPEIYIHGRGQSGDTMTPENTDDNPPTDTGPEEYPGEDELPDESVTVDDVSPFEKDPSEYNDINEFAKAELESDSTARERVREVIKRMAHPKSASQIAELAEVSETTARTELNRLAEEEVVMFEDTSNGRVYQRDPDWYLMKHVQRLAKADDLELRIQSLKREIKEYQEKYETDTPAEVTVGDGVLTDEEFSDVSHWRTAERDLKYLQAAYRFREAKLSFSRDSQRSPKEENTEVTPI